jgi:hypothetical protein
MEAGHRSIEHAGRRQPVSKIPPAAWQDPEAFEPEEVREVTEEEEPEPHDGSFKKIAEEDDEAVEDPQED